MKNDNPRLASHAVLEAAVAPLLSDGSPRPPTWEDLKRDRIDVLPSPAGKGIAVAAVCLLLAGAACAVYLTGGTRFAVLHAAYIPVIVAGGLFGVWGGVATGIAAGLLLGPFMPLDVGSGQMQLAANWITRLVFFATAGLIVGSLMDILRRQHARLQWFARHNPVTGLPNTEALIKDLTSIAAGRKGNNRYALMLIQINNYEEILNALGTRAGVDILKEVALRLLRTKPDPGQVYDLHTDKLAVLISSDADGGLDAFVNSVRRLPNRPLSVNGVPIYADLSVGAVSLGYEPHSPDELIQRANIALHQAHQRGSFYVPYAYESDEIRKRNLGLLARLPEAIDSSQLYLEYQPKVDLQHRRSVGAEALVRWLHPQLGRVPPGDFIPLAERSALIHPLTRWVMREAISRMAAMHGLGRPVAIAINVSPRNLEDHQLMDHLLGLLAAHRLSPICVELEITESAILGSSRTIIDRLADLRHQGVKISIDDFGTGYTSLSQLAELPIDCLKIDQVFIRRLRQDRRQRSIVGSMIDLAQRLELTTVAEGIEDQETADLLAEMGCDVGQGFLFSRPLAAEALDAWLVRESVPEPQ